MDPRLICIPREPPGGWPPDVNALLREYRPERVAWGPEHRTREEREAVQKPEWRDR